MVGRLLLAGWLLMLICVVLVGERHSSLSRLEAGVASGQIRSVSVTEGLPEGGRGYVVVEASWRQGSMRYATEVVEARPRRAAARVGDSGGVTGVIGQDLGARLSALDPDVAVTTTERPSTSYQVFGWQVPGLLPLGVLALTVGTLSLLVLGPQPWRATRWAWGWLMWCGPIGALAYLVLGGPTSFASEPRDPSRRLTGGWAFAAVVVIGGASA